MNTLETLFPNRPLRVLRSGNGQFWPFVGMLFSLALTLGFLAWQVPTFVRDYQISQSYMIAPDGEMLGGYCRSRMAIAAQCSVQIAYDDAGTRRNEDVGIMFLSFDAGSDYYVDVVRSTTDPAQVTISLAVEKFWNRVALSGLITALLVFLTYGGLKAFLRGRASAKALREPARLTPMAATLVQQASGSFLGAGVSFQYVTPEGKTRKVGGWLKRKEQPLFLPDGSVLVAMPEGGKTPVLLDEGLQRVDLTEAERAEIFAKIDAMPA